MHTKQLVSAILMVFFLSGCESVTEMSQKVGDSIKSIEMPKLDILQSKKDAAGTDASGNALVSRDGDACPQVKALPDLATVTQFKDEASTAADMMISSTKMDKVSSTCSVAGNSVSVELALDFSGTLGPIGVKDLDGQANYTYPYFISVVSPDGKILSKDVFALSMVYENGQINYHRQDKLRQVIPLGTGQDAGKFQIMIGFQLSESELAYNRAHPAK